LLGLGPAELLVLCIILIFYFLPTMIAVFRRHPNALAIAVLNLLAGWTFVGYVVALVWSLIAIERRR
jgi:hypothetical protein